MLFRLRKYWSSVWLAAIVFLLGAYALPVFGEEEMTIEQYINDATPYLHHSCESAWDASGQDAEEYVAIINRFVPVIFINHDFDIQRLADAPRAVRDAAPQLARLYADGAISPLERPADCRYDQLDTSAPFELRDIFAER